MKNNGLNYRIKEEDKAVFLDWITCLICNRNSWDALHHIISPSFRGHIKGEHNSSIYNACPIHNFKHPNAEGHEPNCHIGNESFLYSEDTIRNLLQLVKRIVDKAIDDGIYKRKEKDNNFLKTYERYYN